VLGHASGVKAYDPPLASCALRVRNDLRPTELTGELDDRNGSERDREVQHPLTLPEHILQILSQAFGRAKRIGRPPGIAHVREDKGPGQATTLEELREVYEHQFTTKGRAGG
jgi:hypothetical protein